MAIDTAAKRRAVSGLLHFLAVGVTPAAGKPATWRQQAGWGYSGILASGVTARLRYQLLLLGAG